MIYVDDAFIQKDNKDWCHLMADSFSELEAFARQIGLYANWRHNDHYDVTRFYRRKAVEAGAIEITIHQAVELRRKQRRAKLKP